MSGLGKWALLDIETTGIEPGEADIIDIGYLCFEGTKLTKKFQSLVHTDQVLSPFITNLTGITQKMVNKAPTWDKVEDNLTDLAEHTVLAHNAAFESSFLRDPLKSLDVELSSAEENIFSDSLLYLALIHPGRSGLSLESFIVDYEIAETEIHRGYEDSVDLLKVLLRATYELQENNKLLYRFIKEKIKRIPNYWFSNFIELTPSELQEIAEAIDFELKREIKSAAAAIYNDHNPLPEFNGENIAHAFQDVENIKKYLPNYEQRGQQTEMALRVGQSFKHGIHAMIQAPTGTGKSLGYLIPSILFSKSQKEQVLITTGTKILQSQLEDKDVELAYKFLGIDDQQLKITKLIGTSNHLCQAKFEHIKTEEGALFSATNFSHAFTEVYFETIFYFNSIIAYKKMVTTEDTPKVLGRVVSDYDEYKEKVSLDFKSCLGRSCPYIKNCSYYKGLEEAKKANIIIGNHALTFQWPKAIDRPKYIIFDEAHKVEDSATQAFSVEISFGKLNRFVTKGGGSGSGLGALYYLLGLTDDHVKIPDLRKSATKTLENIKNYLDGATIMTEKVMKEMNYYTAEYWNERNFVFASNNPIDQSIVNELGNLKNDFERLKNEVSVYYMMFDGREWENEQESTAWSYFKSFYNYLEETFEALVLFLTPSEDYSRSLFFHESYGIELKSIPIDIGRYVHDEVIKKSDSVIYTSATLGSMDGKRAKLNIEWLTGYLYTDAEKRYKGPLFLEPVFDYKNKAKVYLCSDLPPIYTTEYVEKTIEGILPSILKKGGRSLLLFSSYKRFELARELLLMKLQGKIEIFYQGMGKGVVEHFKKTKNAVLIGLESFGEGIDIPGEKLQFIYIDKIPDLHKDAVTDRRKEFFDKNLGNSFSEYFMATRTRKLQQKLGRLIRSQDDSGEILITDPRVSKWKSRTLNEFKSFLAPYNVNICSFAEAVEQLCS